MTQSNDLAAPGRSRDVQRTALTVAVPLIYIAVLLLLGFEYFVLFCLTLTLLGASALLFFRFRPPKTCNVRLRGVSPTYALAASTHALLVLDDDRFGFPSGSFLVTSEADDVLVAREYVPPARGWDTFKRFAFLPWRLTAPFTNYVYDNTSKDGGGFLLFVQIIRFVATALAATYLFLPLLLASIVEIILKPIVASRIEVRAEPSGSDVELICAFQGPTAMAVKERFLSSFAPPVLPQRYARFAVEAAA